MEFLRLIRVKQWIKNFFVLAPLIFSASFTELALIEQSLFALVFFCIASSVIYIFNDLIDVKADQMHPTKAKRPLATGKISKSQAISLIITGLVILLAGILIMPKVLLVIGVYVCLNVVYSLFLKNYAIWDIFSIAISFVLRVYAGAVALDVQVSGWMLITTLSLALFLASIKRRQELALTSESQRKSLQVYSIELLNIYALISLISSLLFYSMFVLTTHPELIFSIVCVLLGFFRYWLIVYNQKGGESPTDTLMGDIQLIVIAFVWLIISLWAMMPN